MNLTYDGALADIGHQTLFVLGREGEVLLNPHELDKVSVDAATIQFLCGA